MNEQYEWRFVAQWTNAQGEVQVQESYAADEAFIRERVAEFGPGFYEKVWLERRPTSWERIEEKGA